MEMHHVAMSAVSLRGNCLKQTESGFPGRKVIFEALEIEIPVGKSIFEALEIEIPAGKVIFEALEIEIRGGKSIFKALKIDFPTRKVIFEALGSISLREMLAFFFAQFPSWEKCISLALL